MSGILEVRNLLCDRDNFGLKNFPQSSYTDFGVLVFVLVCSDSTSIFLC